MVRPRRSGAGVGLDEPGRVAAILWDVLGADVMGVYLHGSAVFGGLKPNSDIDILAIVRWPTTDAQKRLLVGHLTRISRRGDPAARSIELELLVHRDVSPWRYPAPVDFQYGDWLGPAFDKGELTPWASPDPDTALLLTAVLRADHPILGPRPAALLDPIPSADVRRAALASIPQLLGWLKGDEANVTLTLARIWVTLVTGAIVPKDVAADWALERLPAEHRPVLEHARDIYLRGLGDAWEADLMSRVRPHIDHVVQEIRGAAAKIEPLGDPATHYLGDDVG